MQRSEESIKLEKSIGVRQKFAAWRLLVIDVEEGKRSFENHRTAARGTTRPRLYLARVARYLY